MRADPVKIEFHGILADVPEGALYQQQFRSLAELLFGMTPVDSDDKKAAKWACAKAAQLIPALKREAQNVR